MTHRLIRFAALGGLTALLVATTGCPGLFDGTGRPPPSAGDDVDFNSPQQRPGEYPIGASEPFNLSAVRTSIPVAPLARVDAGDDMIAYGTGADTGVDFIFPAAGDTAGRGIPNGALFSSNAFAAVGTWIVLVQPNGQVSVFETDSGAMTTFPTAQLQMPDVPEGLYQPGHPQAHGAYAVIRNSAGNEASDGNAAYIKAIRLTASAPELVPLTQNPPAVPWHAAVDSASSRVLAAVDDTFYLYNLLQPTQPPVPYFQDVGINDGLPYAFNGVWTLFYSDEDPPRAYRLEIPSGVRTELDIQPADGQLDLGTNLCSYFTTQTFKGHFRNAHGEILGPSLLTGLSLDVLSPSQLDQVDNLEGWGRTTAVTPDDSYTFIAGRYAIGAGEFLQVARTNDFQTVDDPINTPAGLAATDVAVSFNVCAFKTGTNGTESGNNTVLGYILLPTQQP